MNDATMTLRAVAQARCNEIERQIQALHREFQVLQEALQQTEPDPVVDVEDTEQD